MTMFLKQHIDLNNPRINIAAIDAVLSLVNKLDKEFEKDMIVLLQSMIIKFKEKKNQRMSLKV